MADEAEVTLTVEAARLIYDLATGCTATLASSDAPGVVIARYGAPIPRTRGQIRASLVDELVFHRLVDPVGESFPQPLRLSILGKAYYDRHMKKQWAAVNRPRYRR